MQNMQILSYLLFLREGQEISDMHGLKQGKTIDIERRKITVTEM